MKPEKELQWFPAYPEKWLLSKSVRLMTFEQRGAYMELLMMEWRDGSISADTEELAILLNLSQDQFEAIWKRVGPMFTPAGPGLLQNEWLEEIRAEQAAKHEKASLKAKRAADARWGGASHDPSLAIVEGGCPKDAPSIPEASLKEAEAPKAVKVNRSQFIYELLPPTHQTPELLDALKGYLKMRAEYKMVAWKESTMRDHAKSIGALSVGVAIAGIVKATQGTWKGLFFGGIGGPAVKESAEAKRARLMGAA